MSDFRTGDIEKKLKRFKKRYHTNALLKTGTLWLAGSLALYLTITLAESALHFGIVARTVLFYTYLLAVAVGFILGPAKSLAILVGLRKGISDKEAAELIGKKIPSVSDRLLNLLQLSKDKENELAQAAVQQQGSKIARHDFSKVVKLRKNRRFLPYLVIPVLLIAGLFVFIPKTMKDGTERLVRHNEAFEPKKPFTLRIVNEFLLAFRNEDYRLQVVAEGELMPESVYMIHNKRRIKMRKDDNGQFTFLFPKIQDSKTFTFEAAGFEQGPYTVAVKNRPALSHFDIALDYPAYTGKTDEMLANLGNITVPEGTKAVWRFHTQHSDSAKISLASRDSTTHHNLGQGKEGVFNFEKTFTKPTEYELALDNDFGSNADKIRYKVDVVKDKYPKITLKQFQDTTLFSYVIFGGDISDDYGLTALNILYKRPADKRYRRVPIRIERGRRHQGYYHQWFLDSLGLEPGEEVAYFLQVTDNDAINGRKSSKTGTFTFRVPSRKEIKDNIAESSQRTATEMDDALKNAQDLKKNIERVEERLRGKNYLDWQDKQALEHLQERRKKIEEDIENLKEQFKDELQKRKQFENSQENEKIAENVEKLQKLMDEVLDDKTKKLYEELQKLLSEQNQDPDAVRNKLDQIKHNEENLEEELERTLELFKKMKYDMKLENMAQNMENLSEKQKELADKKTKNKDLDELAMEQEKIDKEMDGMKEDMKELEQLNQDLKNPNAMPDTKEQEKSIEQKQQDFKNAVQKKQSKKAQESQKEMSKDMKKLAQKMRDMQSGMEMQAMQENLDNLRDIQSNLITASFDQEEIMKTLRAVNLSDPKFVKISQRQLKLKDDTQVIKDSLNALAQRVFQISSFVTRKVNEMNSNMDKSLTDIKERSISGALTHQQLTMTSMNDLALLLDQVMSQMQNQMNGSGNGKSKQSQSKPGNMKLSDLQKQLNKKIEQLKKSGKKGRELSKEIAKIAAEQEQIRRALEKEGKGKPGDLLEEGKDGKNGKKAGDNGLEKTLREMEMTEQELVNKQLTQKMIKRQKEILTRMLEAEKAQKERDLDEKREAEKASDYDKAIPKAFEEYIKLKEKELERLKTVPMRFNPYYKNEVERFFQRKNKQASK
ncbi:ATPase [Fulvitalea axinellae]|uniref:ATPase n=1 Tax=Fulvitalea axinellae TaxID=1182444 RepID=A0AAU9CMP6_9BACT|nr:ATPase [Fulvitalea axinellae]